MERNEIKKRIANVLTRESAAKLKLVGAVLLSWIVGAVAESFLAGVALLLVLLVPIWRTYTGNQIAHKWFRNTVSAFWIALGGFAVLIVGVSWWASVNAPKTVAVPMTPAQIREQQIQAALNRGEPQLVAYIKSSMGDPDSFELVDGRYVDGGDHITLVMTYRGRNGFNALRRESVGATFDLQGNLTSVNKIEE